MNFTRFMLASFFTEHAEKTDPNAKLLVAFNRQVSFVITRLYVKLLLPPKPFQSRATSTIKRKDLNCLRPPVINRS